MISGRLLKIVLVALVLVGAGLLVSMLRVSVVKNTSVVKPTLSPLVTAMKSGVGISELGTMLDSDHALLFVPSPPLGLLPIEHAVLHGKCQYIPVLMGEPGDYDEEMLIELLHLAYRKKSYDCIWHIVNAIPAGDVEGYRARVSEVYSSQGVHLENVQSLLNTFSD